MTSVTLAEAQAKLAELIQQLAPGEEVVITDDGRPIAQVKKAQRTSWGVPTWDGEGPNLVDRSRLRRASGRLQGVHGVNILLDTHTLLWFLRDDPNLSAVARETIVDPENHKFVSIASCWEIAIKASRKRLQLTEPSGSLLGRELPLNGFDLLPIELRHATHVELMPDHHKDPFDRLLIAQSLLENMPLVSIDQQLDPYGVTRLW